MYPTPKRAILVELVMVTTSAVGAPQAGAHGGGGGHGRHGAGGGPSSTTITLLPILTRIITATTRGQVPCEARECSGASRPGKGSLKTCHSPACSDLWPAIYHTGTDFAAH